MVARFDGPISDEIDHREAERNGEEETCDRCQQRGIIGDNIHAAHTAVHGRIGFPWWICQACIQNIIPDEIRNYPRGN